MFKNSVVSFSNANALNTRKGSLCFVFREMDDGGSFSDCVKRRSCTDRCGAKGKTSQHAEKLEASRHRGRTRGALAQKQTE